MPATRSTTASNRLGSPVRGTPTAIFSTSDLSNSFHSFREAHQKNCTLQFARLWPPGDSTRASVELAPHFVQPRTAKIGRLCAHASFDFATALRSITVSDRLDSHFPLTCACNSFDFGTLNIVPLALHRTRTLTSFDLLPAIHPTASFVLPDSRKSIDPRRIHFGRAAWSPRSTTAPLLARGLRHASFDFPRVHFTLRSTVAPSLT